MMADRVAGKKWLQHLAFFLLVLAVHVRTENGEMLSLEFLSLTSVHNYISECSLLLAPS